MPHNAPLVLGVTKTSTTKPYHLSEQDHENRTAALIPLIVEMLQENTQ